MFSNRLGELLQHARKQLNMSREELARRAKVSTRLVAELERGQRPNVSLESTLKLLNLVGVSIVAKAPDGATAEIRNSRSAALERTARAALRRRTWTGERIHLRDEGGAPGAGRSDMERLSAVSLISKQAYALSDANSRPRSYTERVGSHSHAAAKSQRTSESRSAIGVRRRSR